MGYLDDGLPLELPVIDSSIIKVIGVGGGGGNAVNHMYRQGITDVSFVVCNTDNQALIKSPVPNKIQLGEGTTLGLGAGGDPKVARRAAEESIDKIQSLLHDNTKMVFITAGMGGGTGTGASPVVAKAAHELGILTVGIVTIPFAFEGKQKKVQALEGVAELSEHVDAILVINNEKLKEIYPDLELSNAFAKADDVLTNAAKGIAEIITVPGYINTDFADVYSIMKDGKVAIMNTGYASGENRISKAIQDALNSPLLNTNDVSGASKVLLSLYCSTTNQIKMEEVQQIHDFMNKVGDNVQVIWGATFDDNLGDSVKITIIATGYGVGDIPGMPVNVVNSKKTTSTTDTNGNVLQSMVNAIQNLNSDKADKEEKDPMQKIIEEYYGTDKDRTPIDELPLELDLDADDNKLRSDAEKPKAKAEPELETFTLDDLENATKLKKIENIPAWKRRFMKN
ncbi:MAG: cell division protein FtsZ [Porphyromonadaceae bacterium CG2_30_38_12]|nr:MAG: cell division protein FtsZ [Porphyromonadaceae bacterium CG2_30_38_12]